MDFLYTNQNNGEAGETIPGTLQLVDAEGVLQRKHGKGTKSDIVLVPAPSNDPNDPLNWSTRRKMLSTACMCIFVLMTGLAGSAIYSILTDISESTGLSLNDLNAGTGYQYLAFGWGCLVWQPLAQQYGKRPAYLLSLLLTLVTTVIVPFITTPGVWMAVKVLQGFVGAPIETFGEISVADIYFQHERGVYIALYAFTLFSAGFLAPVFAGFINDGQGWEWVQYWMTVLTGIGLVFCFFFLEETNYHRKPLELVSENPNNDNHGMLGSMVDSTADKENSHTVLSNVTGAENPDSTPSEEDLKPKPYWRRLSLFGQKRPFTLHHRVSRQLNFLTSYPIIWWCGFSYGSNLILYTVLNATAALILTAEPYKFKASMVGLSYLAPMIGVGVAWAYTGLLGDWLVLKITRRNGGTWQSEQRLWLFCLSVVLVPSSLILWGVGAYHYVHWFGLVFAMGMIGCAATMGAQLTLSYCIDTYTDLSADAVVGVIIIRNTMSFGVSYGVTPWVTNMGYQNAFILAAMVGMAQALTFLPIIKWGPVLRKRSRNSYYQLVRHAMSIGDLQQ